MPAQQAPKTSRPTTMHISSCLKHGCALLSLLSSTRWLRSHNQGSCEQEKVKKTRTMAPTEKQRKASLKEGGKKGQDLAGMRDMGGVKFFSVAIESANGEWELMDAVLQGMNKKVDDSADDRKGGAGDIGKCLLFANAGLLMMLCHVPDVLKDEIVQKDWFQAVISPVGGEVIKEARVGGEGEGLVIKAEMKADPEKEKFPLKERDVAIAKSFEFLVSKGLVREEESDDDANYAEMADIEW